MSAPPFILASASPRRADLLKRLLPEFTVVPSEAEELRHDQLTACELARVNAVLKARAVARCFPEAVVLGADTLVCLEGQLFGKPADLAEARDFLAQLQGRTHQVVTGVCLISSREHRQSAFTEMTDVHFRSLGAREIDDYLASIDPLDKAGAYAIQEAGAAIVDSFAGSYSNVVGLPLERLEAELGAWGITTPSKSTLTDRVVTSRTR